MSIHSAEELAHLRAIGSIVAQTLQKMAAGVRPGVTTAELDEVARREFENQGAQSSPAAVYNFPGTTCISVNSQVVHGIPGPKTLRPGDLVKLDVTAQKAGYVADAAITVAVEPASVTSLRLAACARSAFQKALGAARAGNRVSAIGRAVEREVKDCGFEVLRQWCGHGVGRSIHEAPTVPNYYDPLDCQVLTEGLVITIEPIITAGRDTSYVSDDGWTVVTGDGALSAHHEHTIVITKGEPIVLTAA
jgi:methionyl aminopeptidase